MKQTINIEGRKTSHKSTVNKHFVHRALDLCGRKGFDIISSINIKITTQQDGLSIDPNFDYNINSLVFLHIPYDYDHLKDVGLKSSAYS
ncbi:CLUMA_CG005878, isoform A [Clunio marinus]|uniref:CLUMA_CG005878, isoform A n=1 Tax=Clunio marinus TaxID=568069 RepID=A0A1J1HW33_9DIPT|nr:CLUMA_CG005878, isoform A [Clunio marinus]